MIHSLVEAEMRSAIDLDENKNEDGSINWNFVDADVYAACAHYFKDEDAFYDSFNEIADVIDTEEMTVESNEDQMEFAFYGS